MVDMANELGAAINLDYAYNHFNGNSLINCVSRIAELIEVKIPSNFESNI